MGRFVILSLFWPLTVILVSIHYSSGTPVPKPQLLPGQIPPHLASHPALSSVAQGKESTLYQFAYNTANRRGPSPSPLVLQNNQERNLHLSNQFAQQRGGQPYLSNPINSQTGSAAGANNQNPELRAFEELQRAKAGGGSGGLTPQASQYQPVPLTQHRNGLNPQVPFLPQQGGPLPVPPGDDNEREDIRKLKSLLNLPSGPLPKSGAGSPTIGVAGERGILDPTQFNRQNQQFPQNSQQPSFHNHNHGHDHHHNHGPTPTPFPVTAQSQNALGALQFGQNNRYAGPTAVPALNVPYGNGIHPNDPSYLHGQDARTIIKSVETSPESYQHVVYIDPIRDPTSINKHIQPSQSLFVMPASDYKSDDFQRLLNRPAEILIDVLPVDGSLKGKDFELHNFSLMLTPSNYARCAQATHKRGYGGKCKLILKVGKNKNVGGPYPSPVTVSYS